MGNFEEAHAVLLTCGISFAYAGIVHYIADLQKSVCCMTLMTLDPDVALNKQKDFYCSVMFPLRLIEGSVVLPLRCIEDSVVASAPT